MLSNEEIFIINMFRFQKKKKKNQKKKISVEQLTFFQISVLSYGFGNLPLKNNIRMKSLQLLQNFLYKTNYIFLMCCKHHLKYSGTILIPEKIIVLCTF